MRKLLFTLILFIPLVVRGAQESPKRHIAYDQMITAARREQVALRSLYFHKVALGLADDKLDPNETGVIGVEYSTITSTLGTLKSKRTAANPDFAAYIVRELVDHGYTKNDTVLVTMTGSFPGMNLAVLIALETLGIPSVRISSLSASSYGANQEDFTWLHMEDVLYLERKLSQRSDHVTLGGTGDVGGGLPEEGKRKLRRTAEKLGYQVIEAKSLRGQAAQRRKLRGSPETYKLLINIGGNHAMLGKGPQGRELPGGWNDPRDFASVSGSGEFSGIIFDFLSEGVPVLNLLHIEDIAKSSGIAIDPQPLPKIGASPIYYEHPAEVSAP